MQPFAIAPVAHIRSDFSQKFGIPRQSGLVPELRSTLIFAPEFRNPDALRGLEGFSHIWLIWQFSEAVREDWSPTVRPPRLGGNTRLGVFATRSPFRPNPIGLSCVRLEKIVMDPELGPTLILGGADLMDGTPVYDIKPYLPYADAMPDAVGGFAASAPEAALQVLLPQSLSPLPEEKRAALSGILSQDPRPRYQKDPGREYGMKFSGCQVRFRVEDGVLTVLSILPCEE